MFQQIFSLCDSISLESDYENLFFISRIERTVIMTLKVSVFKSSLLILSEREMRDTHILFW